MDQTEACGGQGSLHGGASGNRWEEEAVRGRGPAGDREGGEDAVCVVAGAVTGMGCSPEQVAKLGTWGKGSCSFEKVSW